MSQPERQPPVLPRPILTAQQYGWLALGFLAVAVYGSLVPFHFRYLPFEEALARYRVALATPLRVESRSDWAANILLFIPLGFLCLGALTVDRARQAAWAAVLLVVPACALLSAAIEFTQLYFPPRVTSANDIAAESLGALLGTALWLACGQKATAWARQLWGALGERPGSAAPLLPAYLVVLALAHTLPLDLTISPAELYHKYREGRVHLIPFVGGPASLFEKIQKCVTNVAWFLPVGLLLHQVPRPYRWRWPAVLVVGLGLAAAIELAQLLVYTRTCDSTDVITGGLAVLAGWGVGRGYRRRGGRPGAVPPAVAADGAGRPLAHALLVAWLALLVLVNWQPFDFDFSPATALRRLQTLSLTPFADYYQGDYLQAFDQIVTKTTLFLPLGLLLALCWRGPPSHAGLWVLLLALALTGLFEAGQLFLPSRYPSITDVLIETAGVWLGFVVGRRARAGSFLTAEPSYDHAQAPNRGGRGPPAPRR